MEGELVAPSAEIDHWKHQIEDALRTIVAHVIKTGLLIQQAKQTLGISYRGSTALQRIDSHLTIKTATVYRTREHPRSPMSIGFLGTEPSHLLRPG